MGWLSPLASYSSFWLWCSSIIEFSPILLAYFLTLVVFPLLDEALSFFLKGVLGRSALSLPRA